MTEFNLFGFVLCLCAAATGGLRWTLSQLLTQKKELGLGNPMDFLFHLQPTMVFGMLPLLLGHGFLPFLSTKRLFGALTKEILIRSSIKILCGGVLAFALGMTEYLLLAKTSSLTFALSGIIKELVTMIVAQLTGEQQLTFLNWTGFAVCVSGIAFHTYFKFHSSAPTKLKVKEGTGLKFLKQNYHITFVYFKPYNKESSMPLIDEEGSDEEETIYDAKL